MADSNVPADLDVRISAFNMFCDRLSTIEEQLNRLTNNALHEQMSRVGQLDHRLLGFHFPIKRVESKSNQVHHVECRPEALLITINHSCEDPHVPDFCMEDADREFFTKSELAEIDALRGQGTRTHSIDPRTVRLERRNFTTGSVQSCMCLEALERQADNAMDRTLFTEYAYLNDTSGSHTTFLRGNFERDVREYLHETIRLFCLRGHTTACIVSATIYECDVLLLRLHHYGQRWVTAGEEEKRDIPCCIKALENYEEEMAEHTFFGPRMHVYRPMFEAAHQLLSWDELNRMMQVREAGLQALSD